MISEATIARMRAGMLAVSGVSVGSVAALASCATNSSDFQAPQNTIAIPEAGGLEAGAAAEAGPLDAGCKAGDPACTTELLTCEEVDWCAVPTNVSAFYTLLAVWGTGPSDVWAVGSGGTIAHYDGTAWTVTPTGVKNTFRAIWGSGPSDIWAVSDALTIFHGTGLQNGTATWTPVPTSNSAFNNVFISAIWGSSPDDVRIGGRAFSMTDPVTGTSGTGNTFTSGELVDGGAGWVPRLGTATVYSIWGSSSTDVWMVADNSTYAAHERALTLHGSPRPAADPADADGGGDAAVPNLDPLVWTPVDSQAQATLYSVWGSSADDVWAVGSLGAIRHITPADERWQIVPSPTQVTLRSIWGSGPNDIWAVGEQGTILHWDGTSFTASSAELPLGRKPDLNGVWGSGPNDVWIVGDGIALHYTGPKAGVQGGSK